MRISTRILAAPLLALALLVALPSPARADVTAFLGFANRTASTSQKATSNQSMTGAAFGLGLIVVGFEVEGAVQAEDSVKQVAGLKTGMANFVVQTPTGAAQLYATAGAGLYHETLATYANTDLATNIGGGLKIDLTGPLRLRVDYRIIHLRGNNTDPIQRLYVGANLKF